jgi:hypothetical protein
LLHNHYDVVQFCYFCRTSHRCSPLLIQSHRGWSRHSMPAAEVVERHSVPATTKVIEHLSVPAAEISTIQFVPARISRSTLKCNGQSVVPDGVSCWGACKRCRLANLYQLGNTPWPDPHPRPWCAVSGVKVLSRVIAAAAS